MHLCPPAGFNNYGQLGDSSTTTRTRPTRVSDNNATWSILPSHGWAYGFTCAIQSSQSLWCWVRSWPGRPAFLVLHIADPNPNPSTAPPQGYNAKGNLGDNSVITRNTGPVQVSGGGVWVALDLGVSHACAIKSNRQLFCWVRTASDGRPTPEERHCLQFNQPPAGCLGCRETMPTPSWVTGQP